MKEISSAIQIIPLEHYIFVSVALFSIGMMGVLFRRNTIAILMCLELMFNSANLLLTAFSAYHSDPSGQVFVFFIMIVAAAEVAVGSCDQSKRGVGHLEKLLRRPRRDVSA